MRLFPISLVLGTLLGFAGAAQADILASAPVFGGAPGVGGQVTCRIMNVGLGSVNISSRQIINNVGTLATLSSDTCTTPVAPNKYCAFATGPVSNFAFSCRAVYSGVDPSLRGVAEFVNSSNTILNSLPMQ